MKLEQMEKIKRLLTNADAVGNLRGKYLEKTSATSCDKHGMKFGGDSRFSVFSCKVFLDCHTGYYGSSSCSTLATVDHEFAEKYLNAALNEHMDLILKTMAKHARFDAANMKEQAEQEIRAAKDVLDSIDFMGCGPES